MKCETIGVICGRVGLCLAIWVLGAPGSRGQEEGGMSKRIEPTISVSGLGKVSAAPDIADIQLGVVTQAKTAREALSMNSESMAALLGVLKERGVAAKDIETTQINVSPQYSQPPRNQGGQPPEGFVPRIVAYTVTNMVSVTSRDLTKLGEVLDAVVSAGANQIHGITFRIEDSSKLMEVARKQAMRDAKGKAESMAGEAGVVVGPPISISEAAGYAVPRPQMFARGGMMMDAMAAAPAMPVSAGEQEITVNVNVVYRLVLPKGE